MHTHITYIIVTEITQVFQILKNHANGIISPKMCPKQKSVNTDKHNFAHMAYNQQATSSPTIFLNIQVFFS